MAHDEHDECRMGDIVRIHISRWGVYGIQHVGVHGMQRGGHALWMKVYPLFTICKAPQTSV